MAQKIYFMNSDEGARFDDEEFAWFQTLLLTSGIVGDPDTGDLDGYLVHENDTPNMGILVDVGKALLEVEKDDREFKIVVENLEQETLTVEDNDGASNNRVDAVIINIDTSKEPDSSKTNVASLEIIEGDSDTALDDSDIDDEVGDEFWYRLADVTVQPDAVEIKDGDIEDQREKIKFSKAWEREFNPISEKGDLVQGGSDGASERLPIGEDGEVLSVKDGKAKWASNSPYYEVFESSDTFDASNINLVEVEVVGGGGAGGGTRGDDNEAGAGGGGGGMAKKIIDVSDVSEVTVTVGSGGNGSSEDDGGSGGDSSFGDYCSATGGEGGDVSGISSIGGGGGSGSDGDINLEGSAGHIGGEEKSTSDHSYGSARVGGAGGASPISGGAKGVVDDNDGNNASGYGGGGSGAQTDSIDKPGGDGADGVVIVKVLA